MREICKTFRDSFLECRNLKSIVVSGMLTALMVILVFFKITFGDIIYITFGFLAVGLIGYLYGPVLAAVCGGIGDIIVALIRPTGPYFVGFTISAMLGGLIYGLLFYKKSISFLRILLAMLLVGVFVNILWNSFCLTLLYGYGFLGILPMRVLKNIASIPINACIFYFFIKSLQKSLLDKLNKKQV